MEDYSKEALEYFISHYNYGIRHSSIGTSKEKDEKQLDIRIKIDGGFGMVKVSVSLIQPMNGNKEYVSYSTEAYFGEINAHIKKLCGLCLSYFIEDFGKKAMENK